MIAGFIWHDLRADYLSTLAYWNVQLSSSVDQWVRVGALWLNERRTDTLAVARNHWAARLLSAGESRGNLAEIQQEIERGIAHMAAVNGFVGGAVGDRDCRIAAQTGLRPEMAQGVQEACQWVQQAGEYRVDAFGMEQGHVWLGLSAPVIAEGRASSSAQITRRTLGSVTMVVEPWEGTLRIFAPESVPTGTSEGLLVWKKASEAFIFSPRLSARGVESFFRRPLTGSTFESRVALDGDVAFGEFIDYRGQPVFGAARRIGAPGYSLARKIDRGEALVEHRHRAVLEELVGTLSILLSGFVMVALHRHAAAREFEERARQQEALRERDRRYRVLYESAGDGILLMRGEHFVDCNQKALELFGCGREQLIGNTPSAFSPPQQPNGSDSQEAAVERTRLALEGQTLHFEWQHLRFDGTPFEAEITLSRLEIAGEAHLLALVRDVTEHKRAEEALRDSEQRYKDFISYSNEGVWRVGLEQPIPIDLPEEEGFQRLMQYGYTAECNLAHARNFGYSTPEEMVGIRLRDLVLSSDQGRLESLRSAARGGWRSRTVEFRGLDKAGNLKHILRTEIPIVENGMLVHIWGMTRDISERKRAEEELQRSLEQLRALAARLQSIREEERKRVAREIHDQLGQALTAIKIDLSSLVHDLPADKKQESESVLNLIDQTIQSVRRISTELRPGILDDLGLVAAVEWVGEEFEARTRTKCRLDLPQEDIIIDQERATALFRILQETLTNVARHANATQVNIRLTQEEGGLNLEIRDNGEGFSEEKLSAGRTLGILGMRERALLLGGELIISGVPGQGTVVSVRIPEARQN